MRQGILWWLVCAVVSLVGCAGAQRAPEPTPAPVVGQEPAFSEVAEPVDVPVEVEGAQLASAIKEVTVYSDRALVKREAKTPIKGEPEVFVFKGLPGWVDDGSVRVATSAGRIVDVRVVRTFLARTTDKNWQQAEDRHRELQEEMAALNDELTILAAQKAQIENIEAFSKEKLSLESVSKDIKVETYGQMVGFISQSLRETAAAKRKVEAQRAKLAPEIQASQRGLDELRNLMKLEETAVLVTLQSSQPAEATLELTYLTPGATWEPKHELRASSDSPESVELTSFAVVTQTSGEDWTNATISFSTQSSSEAVRIPELEALTLGETQSTSRVVTQKVSSFSRAQDAFEGQNVYWNRRNLKKTHNFEEIYQENLQYLQVVQSKTVQLFEALQRRGTTAHFEAEGLATVRSDGQSVRLRIGKNQLKARQKIVAAPEQSLNAVLTAELINQGDQSLLPGAVALYRDGAFVGLTEMEFVAGGESFSVFLSVADQLKLSRNLDRKLSSIVRQKRTRMKVAFVVTVENLSESATSLLLADRIPVSQNKEIKVENVRIEPEIKPDSQGLLQWDLALKPKELRRFKISYEVEYPPTLILETERQRSSEPAPRPGRAPQQRKEYKLEEQLYDLEQNF
jgi:uncharacterized protein (TIGR02231 family)